MCSDTYTYSTSWISLCQPILHPCSPFLPASRSLVWEIENARGDDRCRFLTILDNVLTVGELAGGEDRFGQPHPHPGDLLEGAGVGGSNCTAAEIAKTLRRQYELRKVREDCWRPYSGKWKLFFFYIGVAWVQSKHTQYVLHSWVRAFLLPLPPPPPSPVTTVARSRQDS